MQKEVPHSEASAVLCPRELAIAIVKDAGGTCNPIALGFVMRTSIRPPMLAVSIVPTHHSAGAIRHAGEFVVAYPSEHQAEETLLYGTKSGRDVNKLALTGAQTQPATVIDGVLLADAVANFECKLVGEMTTGDHVIFVGEVVCSHLNEAPPGRCYIIGPGHRLGGIEACRTGGGASPAPPS